MKKFTSFFLALTMSLSLLAGCGGNETTPSDSNGGKSESSGAETVVIGGSGPLTGNYATYGISVRQGALLAVNELNAKGGVNGMQLELKFDDNEADGTKAVSSYATLMDKGMHVTLGGTTSGCTIAVAEEAQKDGILLLTPSGSQKDCTKYDNAFRVCYMDPDLGFYSANFIKDNNMASKVAVLYDKSNDYSAGVTEAFLNQAKEIGLEVVTQQAYTDQSNTDFSVQLQAVKSSGADLLFMPIYAQEAAYVLTQAGKMNLDVKFFGADGMDGIIEKIGEENLKYAEGLILLTPYSADSPEEPTVSFVKNYKENFGGQVPDQFAADAYDAVYIIAACLEKSGAKPSDKDFNEKMIAAMTEIEVTGVTGTMTWSENGEPTKPAKAVEIVEGAYKELK